MMMDLQRMLALADYCWTALAQSDVRKQIVVAGADM